MRSSHFLGLVSLAVGANAALYNQTTTNHTCIVNSYQGLNSQAVLSCSPQANRTNYDSCCVETYGGLFLATQFWDTYTGGERNGQLLPPNEWSIHGLWPDFCNGSYTQYCDLNRQYDPYPSPNTTNGLPNGTVVPAWKGANVTTFLRQRGRLDLLAYMNRYWLNQGDTNDVLWAHEFSKHGTCFSTFDLPCYGPNYTNNTDLVDYYEATILYYQRLPTWGWLSAAGIRPSNATNVGYSIRDIQNALVRGYGKLPYIGCSGPRYNETAAGRNSTDNGRTELSEVWYNFYAYGRPQAGAWAPVNATGSVTSCAQAAGAVKYYQRTTGSTWTQ